MMAWQRSDTSESGGSGGDVTHRWWEFHREIPIFRSLVLHQFEGSWLRVSTHHALFGQRCGKKRDGISTWSSEMWEKKWKMGLKHFRVVVSVLINLHWLEIWILSHHCSAFAVRYAMIWMPKERTDTTHSTTAHREEEWTRYVMMSFPSFSSFSAHISRYIPPLDARIVC